MARSTRSTRNDTQRQSALVERSLPDLTGLDPSEAGSIAESAAAVETLNLGHAGLQNECWSGASGIGSGSCRGESGAPRLATQRLLRAPRKRTPLHRLRSARGAEARFTPDNLEILTD
jgi:hypothetical protein